MLQGPNTSEESVVEMRATVQQCLKQLNLWKGINDDYKCLLRYKTCNILVNKLTFSEGGSTHKDISEIIVFMVCKDIIPVRFVGKEGFNTLMIKVAPM